MNAGSQQSLPGSEPPEVPTFRHKNVRGDIQWAVFQWILSAAGGPNLWSPAVAIAELSKAARITGRPYRVQYAIDQLVSRGLLDIRPEGDGCWAYRLTGGMS